MGAWIQKVPLAASRDWLGRQGGWMEGKGWCRAGHGVRESTLLQVILRIHIEPSSVSLEGGGSGPLPLHPLAYGPATPPQEGVGGRVAAKEKWVWGGGCGCECGCIGRWGQGGAWSQGKDSPSYWREAGRLRPEGLTATLCPHPLYRTHHCQDHGVLPMH